MNLHPDFIAELRTLLIAAYFKRELPDDVTYAMLKEIITAHGLTLPDYLP